MTNTRKNKENVEGDEKLIRQWKIQFSSKSFFNRHSMEQCLAPQKSWGNIDALIIHEGS